MNAMFGRQAFVEAFGGRIAGNAAFATFEGGSAVGGGLDSAVFHPRVEYLDGGGLVDDFAVVAGFASGLVELFGGGGGC